MFKCFLLILLFCYICWCRSSKGNLKLLHIIFRHGDVTNQETHVYPKDPYKNETYYPFGYAQLINKGKMREFDLGQKIMDYYGDFLGDTYYPGLLYALSTATDRTKCSLELVLAGMFPPTKRLTWNKRLRWQPIPYDVSASDPVLSGKYTKEYQIAYEKHQNSLAYKTNLYKHKNLLDYLSEKSGWNVDTFKVAKNLYKCLQTEQIWGFALPKWSESVFPEKLYEMTVQEFKEAASTTELKKYGTGYFLEKIINDTKSIPNSSRRLFLYSAHETNLASILMTLGVFDSKIPDFGSHIFFEAYQTGCQTYLRILYGATYSKPKSLVLPECQEYCPLQKFVELYKKYLP